MKTPPKTTVECPSCRTVFDVNLNTARCLRCGHRWVPRRGKVRQCPKCRSLLWDEPKPVARAAPPAKAAERRPEVARPAPILQITTGGPTSAPPAATLRPINDLTLEELDAELEQGRDNPRAKGWPGALKVLRERRAKLAAEHQNGTSSLSAAP